MERLLQGMKVVEYADMVTGPYCGKLLSDFGAQVIKIEDPLQPDTARDRPPFFGDKADQDDGILFHYLNSGKQGITLDIRRAEGRAIFDRLLAKAHVLIEDVQSSEKAAVGLTPADMENTHPHLIHISATAMGCTGPHKDYKTHPFNRYMAGGEGAFTYIDDPRLVDPPVQGPEYLADYEGGIGATIALLGAYYKSLETGKGLFIDFSEQEWSVLLNGFYLAKYPNENVLMDRHVMQYKLGGRIQCKDGHVILMILDDRHWWRLIKLLGDPSWAFDEKYDSQFKRTLHGEELNAELEKRLARYEKEELYHLLQKNGIPVGPIYTPEEVMNSPQLQSRRFFLTQKDPERGEYKIPCLPFKCTGMDDEAPEKAPGPGEHNQKVFAALDMSQDEMDALKKQGII